MGIPVLVYGKSGSGKSRSLKNFGEKEITLINVESKPLPFRKKFEYIVNTDNYNKIFKAIGKAPTKTIVIDDAGYLLTNMFMRGHASRGSGASTFDLYNDIGDKFWSLFEFIKKQTPPDVIVYIIMHEEESDSGTVKLKMMGKLLEQKVCVEGMVTIVIRCMCEESRHYFRVRNSGTDITKSPEDMFEHTELENDLKMIDDSIRQYYQI